MIIENRLNKFLQKAKEKHGNTYDYSNVNYTYSNEPVKIICKLHGVFEQKPVTHIRGCGCPTCGFNTTHTKRTKNTEFFIEKSNKVHNFKFDYSKTIYLASRKKVIITCPIHGDFEQIACTHMAGKDCWECGVEFRANVLRNSLEDFIHNAAKIHNNFYDYSETNYINNKLKVKIICPIHGLFEQKANNHLNGHGCSKCIAWGGWGTSRFINKYDTALLYIIQLTNPIESFIKIGITNKDLKSRFKSKNHYIITSLLEIKKDAEWVSKLEHSIKKKFKKYQYFPQVKFAGWTECFNLDSLSQIKNYVLHENI